MLRRIDGLGRVAWSVVARTSLGVSFVLESAFWIVYCIRSEVDLLKTSYVVIGIVVHVYF